MVVGIPQDVRLFIDRSVAGLEDLEILRCLLHHNDRAFTASNVAAELGLPERTSAEVLERLGSQNLRDVRSAFWVLAVSYVILHVLAITDEARPYAFMIRLAAFLIILIGIIDKNRSTGR